MPPSQWLRGATVFGLCVLSGLQADAQITFYATDLPTPLGSFYRAYENTIDVDVTGIGQAGGPFRWDISEPRYDDEIVKRMDVVSPADGGHESLFPAAAYAERLTNEANGALSWSYYRVVTNQGRSYYGFYDAPANPVWPAKVFYSPTTDLPASIQYGQTWSRSVGYRDYVEEVIFSIDYDVRFTAQAQVDAYGTLVLPEIGAMPALRVNEVHTYDYTDLSYGLFDYTIYFREYYWLVPGIGKALDVISDGDFSAVPPPDFAVAKTFLRVFQVRPWPVADLRIQRQEGLARLAWRAETNAFGYRVEVRQDFSTNTPWQVVAEPATNSWADAVTNAQPARFFRVFLNP